MLLQKIDSRQLNNLLYGSYRQNWNSIVEEKHMMIHQALHHMFADAIAKCDKELKVKKNVSTAF